ncbi:DUF2066 domain-containing protein [Beggiatoa alba]|nr:DUF2066 domain-containing protein [Beggiatoa alba]
MNCLARVLLSCISFACIFMSQSSLAAKINDLYEAEIPVLSQSRADRHVAIKQAFAEVLLRVSGQQDVVLSLPSKIESDTRSSSNQAQVRVLVGKTAGIKAALKRATFYVKQFRYQKPTGRPHIDWGIQARAENNQKRIEPVQQVLWIRFNKKKINKLLHENGLPVWGKTRPSVLVWMGVESRGKRYLLSNSIKSTTRETIEKYARLYGLPVRFPLMDLVDRANISTSDVWGNFEDRIIQASKRYQTEAILVGRLYLADRTWSTKWNLYVNGRSLDWVEQGILVDRVVKQGLSYTAQNLAEFFADVQTEKGTQHILVEVKEIDGLENYTQAVKYLSSISAVKKVQTIKVNQTSVLFNLTTQGSRIGVMQEISLGSQLLAEPNSVPKQAVPGPPDVEQTDAPTTTADGILETTVKKPANKLVPDLVYRLLQ